MTQEQGPAGELAAPDKTVTPEQPDGTGQPADAEPAVPEQMAVRLAKAERLRAAGVDPYPVGYPRTHTIGQIRDEFSDGVADRISGQGGGDAGCTGAKTMLAAGNIDIAERVGADGAYDGGVVEHRDSLIALGDDHLIDDMKDAPAPGKIWHAMVVRILVGKGRNEKGTEKLARHILRERHGGILAESAKSRAIRVM